MIFERVIISNQVKTSKWGPGWLVLYLSRWKKLAEECYCQTENYIRIYVVVHSGTTFIDVTNYYYFSKSTRPAEARFLTLPFGLPPPPRPPHSRVLDVSTEGALPASNCRRNSQTCSLPSRLGSARCGSAFKNSSPQSGSSFVSKAGSVSVQCPTCFFTKTLCIERLRSLL